MAKTKINPVPANQNSHVDFPLTDDGGYVDALHEAAITAENTGTKIRKIMTRITRVMENHKTVNHRIHRTFKFGY